jgi:hypothetical protein
LPAKPAALRELPIELPSIGPVGVARLKNRPLSPAAQLFIDAARKVAKPLARRRQ